MVSKSRMFRAPDVSSRIYPSSHPRGLNLSWRRHSSDRRDFERSTPISHHVLTRCTRVERTSLAPWPLGHDFIAQHSRQRNAGFIGSFPDRQPTRPAADAVGALGSVRPQRSGLDPAVPGKSVVGHAPARGPPRPCPGQRLPRRDRIDRPRLRPGAPAGRAGRAGARRQG
jgi:hypothetical protein